MSALEHPLWCNIKHNPGANPNRQTHLRHWKSDRTEPLPLLAELYPFVGVVGLKMTVPETDGPNYYAGAIHPYLSPDEARSFADTLYELAAVAEGLRVDHEQRAKRVLIEAATS